jgi:hypothetical protein
MSKIRKSIENARILEDYHHRHLACEEYSITLHIEAQSAFADRLFRAFLNGDIVRLPDVETWSRMGYYGPMQVVGCNTHVGRDGIYSEVTLRSAFQATPNSTVR